MKNLKAFWKNNAICMTDCKIAFIIFALISLVGLTGCRGGMTSASDSAVDDTLFEEAEEVVKKEVIPVKEPTDEEIAAFVKDFKKNIRVGEWIDDGWEAEDENSGLCHFNLTNKNPFDIDGSDYYVVFKYEYLYAEGMHSETVKKKGVNLASGGKRSFNHYYTDDCGPLEPTVKYNLTDREIYDKYCTR